MTIYKNLWAGYEAYFVHMGNSGRYTTGIKVFKIDGEWYVDFNTRFYASDLKYDREHFPVVGRVDIKKVIKEAVMKEIEPLPKA